MKAKYLIDECLSINTRKGSSLLKSADFVNSQYILGKGVSDDEMLEHIKKSKMVLVTNDKRFALKTAIQKQRVVLINQEDRRAYTIKAEEEPSLKNLNDLVTYYLLKTQTVVRP